jgi:hypothetical protein
MARGVIEERILFDVSSTGVERRMQQLEGTKSFTVLIRGTELSGRTTMGPSAYAWSTLAGRTPR